MAKIDLLNLQPQQISRDLRGKYMLLFGPPKAGKTTLAAELDKSLICGFEQGTNALHNVLVQPIVKWEDWKQVVRQLVKDKEKLKDKIHTVVIDTADEAYALCEKYICQEANVDTIKEVAAYGGGYKILDSEFHSTLRDLEFAGYGLLFISHSKDKEQTDDHGEKYIQAVPALADRPFNIINKMVDIIAYLRQTETREGEEIIKKRYLCFREDRRFYAGSRFKHITPQIELSYDNLVKAIYEAIDKEIEVKGGTATEEQNPYLKRDFEDLMTEAKQIWNKVIIKEKTAEASKILEEEFGKPTKFSEITADQTDKLEKVLFKVKELV